MSELCTSKDPWIECMLDGRFEDAWKVSDEHLQKQAGKTNWHLPRHRQNIWNGGSLYDKEVLVRCYHGLGDTIQFCRFLPMLKAMANRVIVWAQAPLIPILSAMKCIDQLLPLHDGTPQVQYDIDVEIMELAYIFRITRETIPHDVPYLQLEKRTLPPYNDNLNVGVVWKPGNWNEHRAIPFRSLLPLNNLRGINLYILQADAGKSGWTEGFGIHPGEFNLHDYARVIKGLDLLISADSMPVHLAGALGVPVWTLLPSDPDWRWERTGDRSAWYPTMRLFRQRQAGNWNEVIHRVVEELDQLLTKQSQFYNMPEQQR